MGAKVRAFDPVGMKQAQALLSNVAYCTDAYDCAEGADALVIVTEWEQFRALDLGRLRDLMACPVLIDLRNIYRPDDMNSCLCERRKALDCIDVLGVAPAQSADVGQQGRIQ